MADNAEYNRLVSRRAQKQREQTACRNRISTYEARLRFLRGKKELVAELKGEYKTHKGKTKNISEEDHKWVGSTYDSFSREMGWVMEADNTYYKYTLDHVLDSINNEITRIENLVLDEYGLLGELGKAINSLGNAIENFFN